MARASRSGIACSGRCNPPPRKSRLGSTASTPRVIAASSDCWSIRGARLLGQHDHVDVAPHPVFTRLDRLDDRMPARVIVLGRMLAGRTVATPDVAAREAHAQVNPAAAALQALLATVRAR